MVLFSKEISAAVAQHNGQVRRENLTMATSLREAAKPLIEDPIYQQFAPIIEASRAVVSDYLNIDSKNVLINKGYHQLVTGKEGYESLGEKSALLIRYSTAPGDALTAGQILYFPADGFKPALSLALKRGLDFSKEHNEYQVEIPVINDNLTLDKPVTVDLISDVAVPGTGLEIYRGQNDKFGDGGQIEVAITEVANVELTRNTGVLIGLINRVATEAESGKEFSEFNKLIKDARDRKRLLQELGKALDKPTEKADEVKVRINAVLYWAKDTFNLRLRKAGTMVGKNLLGRWRQMIRTL